MVVHWAWLIKWGDANPCKKRECGHPEWLDFPHQRVWSSRVAGLPTPGECGHPEWLDFPHQGSVVTQSGWTSHTRGVWSPRVAGRPTPGSSQTDEARQLLHYQYLLKIDKAVQKLDDGRDHILDMISDDGHSFMKSHLCQSQAQ